MSIFGNSKAAKPVFGDTGPCAAWFSPDYHIKLYFLFIYLFIYFYFLNRLHPPRQWPRVAKRARAHYPQCISQGCNQVMQSAERRRESFKSRQHSRLWISVLESRWRALLLGLFFPTRTPARGLLAQARNSHRPQGKNH